MTARALDLEVLRNGRPCDTFAAHGDPEDKAWLESRLAGWLEARGWDRRLWGAFELVAREAGKPAMITKVRAA